MKVVKYLALVSLSAFALAGVARAADNLGPLPADPSNFSGIYLRGDLGASWLHWSSANSPWGLTGGAGIGYQFDSNLRADVTYDWAGNYGVPGGTISTSTLLGNAYYDFRNGSPVTPYIGAGVGYGWQSGNGVPSSQGIEAGVALGAAYELNNNVAVDLGYRFHNMFASPTAIPEHQAAVGLRVKF